MRGYAFKGFLRCTLAATLALVVLLFAFVMRASAFSTLESRAIGLGGRASTTEYYLYDPSSGAVRKTKLTLAELFWKEGESVRFVFSDGGAEEFMQSVLDCYNAEIRVREETGSTSSAYAYSLLLGKGLFVGGERVNLHIAVRGNAVAVGTPIIFGGY